MIDLAKSRTIYRELSGSIEQIISASGWHLYTDTGRTLYDLSGGPCVNSLGHDNPFLKKAITNQLDAVPYVYSGFWGSAPSEKLGSLLYDEFERWAPGWFGKAAFASSGNEAVEFSCRLAYQYHAELKKPRFVFAAPSNGFHGTSLMSGALTDDYGKYMLMSDYFEAVRDEYVLRLPSYFSGVVKRGGDTAQLLERTRQLIERCSSPVAAMIIEPVGGPPVGALAPDPEYLQGLRRICTDNNVLLIFDEVLCGCGRFGSFTAAEHYDVLPDMVLLGKGLTSGYVPLSAVVVSQKIIDVLSVGSGVAMIGTTYFDHTLACACGCAVLEYLRDHDLCESVGRIGNLELMELRHNLRDVSIVNAVHGGGFLWGIRFADPRTNEPFHPRLQFHKIVRERLYKAGIVVYSKGQTVRGQEDFIILSPPFEVSGSELFEVLSMLLEVLKTLDAEYGYS